MKVNEQTGIKMAVQDEFSTMEFVISRHYKAHDHWGYNHKNIAKDDEDKAKSSRKGKKRKLQRKCPKIIMTWSQIKWKC